MDQNLYTQYSTHKYRLIIDHKINRGYKEKRSMLFKKIKGIPIIYNVIR